jgi:hypothetical protein
MRTLRLAIVILVAFVATASADKNVDWSQYIEKPSDKPLVVKGAAPAHEAKPARVTKAKRSAKKASKGRKVKARSKAKSRRK